MSSGVETELPLCKGMAMGSVSVSKNDSQNLRLILLK